MVDVRERTWNRKGRKFLQRSECFRGYIDTPVEKVPQTQRGVITRNEEELLRSGRRTDDDAWWGNTRSSSACFALACA